MAEICPLCSNSATLFSQVGDRQFFECTCCKGIHLPKRFHVDERSEVAVYERHNNDVNDPRYQAFTSPVWKQVMEDFTPLDQGLDFGSGTGPVISKMLMDKGFQIKQYDPYFANYPELLNEKYDYIVSCEVIEHFHFPHNEFERFRKMVLPAGKLYLMTHHYESGTCGDFESWYYIKDRTHVFIYTRVTFEYIKEWYGFIKVDIGSRLIVFS